MTILRPSILLVPTIALALVSSTSMAEDFPERTMLHNSSLANGLGRNSVELLRRAPAPAKAETAARLLSTFGEDDAPGLALSGDVAWTEETPRRLRIQGEGGWSILIKGDGSAARVTNYGYLAHSPRVPPSSRPGTAELEKRGRHFIEERLLEFVALDPDEELVALKTEHQVDTVGAGSTILSEELVASTIVFGRTVQGVHILGPGSKIMVTFANDGAAVAFAFDWPKYERLGRTQGVLDVTAIQERASANGPVTFIGESVQTERFECGYVDFGARLAFRDVDAPVQAGCWVRYKGLHADPDHRPALGDDPNHNVTTTAISEAIPAGDVVELDRGWPVARLLSEGQDVCAETELTQGVLE